MGSESPATAQVLVFDSGLGSLSIGGEIHRRLPGVSLRYLMDREWFPYGLRSESSLQERIVQLVHRAVAISPPDLIVIACNSASTTVLPRLRAELSIPIVGVVPAIKPAAALSQSKCIGVLATPGTVSRGYTRQLIADFAADCRVILQGDGELAAIVEQGFLTGNMDQSALARSMTAFEQHEGFETMDTIVLACTHFPLVKDELAKHWPRPMLWVDSGEAIARRVADLLQLDPDDDDDDRVTSEHQALITGEQGLPGALRERLHQHWHIGRFERI